MVAYVRDRIEHGNPVAFFGMVQVLEGTSTALATQALRRELADTSVRVLYIAPRATRTAMNAPAMEALNAALGNAMDAPETVARQVRRAIERGRQETRLGGPEPFFARLNALCPTLVDRAMRRQLPTIRRILLSTGGENP